MNKIPRDPGGIMKQSMEIIEEYMRDIDISLNEKAVVKRVVHTSGDTSLIDKIKFSPGAIEAGIKALKSGAGIYTDVNMAASGISKTLLDEFGSRVYCDIASPRAREYAEKENITRAAAAVRMNAENIDGGIVAIGNAPTALFELLDLVRRGKARPALTAGVPVGFVGAAESKEELIESDIPYITLPGTRGGSPIAAAIVNAILQLAAGRDGN